MVVVDLAENLDRHRDRVSMYDNASNEVSVEFFDPNKDPIRAKAYELASLPTIAIEYMGRTEKVTTIEEREITSAIIRAVSGQARKMYFVQGHGERSATAADDGTSYKFVADLLKGDNITAEPLALTQHKDIPEDATVVAIAGPTADLLEEEVEQLKRYLDKGGKLMVLLEPVFGERAQPLTRLTGLLSEWGVEMGNDIVIDVSGRSNNPAFVVASPPYPSHSITERFGVSTIFPTARSVSPAAKLPDGKTVQPIVQTASEAWAETDIAGLEADRQPEPNTDKGDKQGPVTLAVAATANVATPPPAEKKEDGADPPTPPQTRIAVFGDADFASGNVANTLGNVDLFLNTVSWLTAQENLISIRPRERSDSRLNITPGQLDAVWYLSILVVPALVLAAGIFAWTRRRRS
jgi:ABC-type uncharacterized transport system involved in gliding motility auxiliary subunit